MVAAEIDPAGKLTVPFTVKLPATATFPLIDASLSTNKRLLKEASPPVTNKPLPMVSDPVTVSLPSTELVVVTLVVVVKVPLIECVPVVGTTILPFTLMFPLTVSDFPAYTLPLNEASPLEYTRPFKDKSSDTINA